MTNVIISDSFLTKEQSRSLPLLLNMIIPPDKEKDMPGAGELDFVGYVSEFEPGQMYYVQLGVGFSFKILPVSNIDGRSGIKGLRNVGKINPADVFSDYDDDDFIVR